MGSLAPDRVRHLARRIASGELRGDLAFDAVVALIAAEEIPVGAPPQLAARIRDQVALGVSHDRELCGRIYGEKPRGSARSEPERSRLPGKPADRSRRASPTKADPAPKRAEPRRARTERRRVPAEPALSEVEFAAGQRRRRVLTGLGVVAGIGAVAGAVWLLRPGPCAQLATNTCADLLSLGPCEVTGVRAELEAHGADAALCSQAQEDVAAAIEGLQGPQRTKVYLQTLEKTLGFDPLGRPKPSEPEPVQAPKPVPIVTDQPQMTSVFIDQAHLFWSATAPAGVYRVRNIGGTAQPLAAHAGTRDVWASDDFVYWLARGPQGATLWADKKRGEHEPQSITLPEDHAPSLAAFMGPEVAYVDESTGSVFVIAVAGGEARSLGEPGPVAPIEIVGDGEFVYWMTPGPGGTLSKASVQGGPVTTLATELGQPRALTLERDTVYWFDAAHQAVQRVSPGGAVESVTTGLADVRDLAVDDSRVFGVDAASGTVFAVPKAGGDREILASELSTPRFVLVDGAGVYWESGGTIFRLPK